MKLIVGLGNPGPKYETTRHNVGFLAVDFIIEYLKDHLKATQAPKSQFDAEVVQAEWGSEKVLFAKPQTFMNLSGKSVGQLMRFYKLEVKDTIVIHDDLDLDSMVIRVKTDGGTGGHNGLKSLHEQIGSGYHRIRVGVGHPNRLGLKMDPADYVLQNYSDLELKELEKCLEQVQGAVELMVQGKESQAMTQYNQKKE